MTRRTPQATTSGSHASTVTEVLRVDGLAKRFGDVEAVVDIGFSVAPGEVVGLLGPNGAGKTTLLSMVVGLVRADAGRIWNDGVDVTSMDPAQRPRVGFAPQDIGLYLPLSVRENLRFFAAVEDIPTRDAGRRIDDLLEQFALGDLADRPASVLSGGEQRRVHVACALVTRPHLVLLDEPTVGLDVGGRADFLRVVRSLAEDGTAVCFSSHYLGEVEDVCERVVVVDHGRIVAAGRVDDLVKEHGDTHVELVLAGGEQRVVPCPDGEAGLAGVLRDLGDELARVESINLVRPSLEAVFLALTGRRFESEAG